MCCKQKFAAKFVLILAGFLAVDSLFFEKDDFVNSNNSHFAAWSSSSHFSSVLPGLISNSSDFAVINELLAYLFQILFLLFLISPPLIVFLLFLIWKELKSRNKMK